MSRRIVGLILSTLLASSAAAGEQPLLPQGPPPAFVTAAMDGKGGGDVVFLRPQHLTRMLEKDGKQFPQQTTVCVPVAAKIDGKAVQAFGSDGKAIDAAEAARRLPKSTPVVVFHAAPPDPYYLQFVREGTVAFVVPRELFEPRPVPPKR